MSQTTKLIVQKYGGATLATPEKVKQAALRIHELRKQGHQVLAVVSAMGQTTNQLIELAEKVSRKPNRRELDMLLTTGERVSMALLSMALNDLACPAISFTGSQAGILTNDSHVNALIVDVKAHRVADALNQGKVVVIAGFQGVSPVTKEITTLGRGGTDTTAVAMAAFLKADRCEILKDVPAVFSADPNKVPDAKQIHELSYEQMLHMTFWGAKVMHYRSVELALQKKVPVYVGPAAMPHQKNSDLLGTTLKEFSKESSVYESSRILSLNSHALVLKLGISPALPKSGGMDSVMALEKLKTFFESNEIPFPQLLEVETLGDTTHIWLTGPGEILKSVLREAMSWEATDHKLHVTYDNSCTVTATATGNSTPELVEKISQRLSQAKIPVQKMIVNGMGVTCFLAGSDRDRALQELHQLIV